MAALCCTGLLTACGGGSGLENGDTGNGPLTVPATSQMAARAYENPDGIDPLPSFRAASLPSSSRFAYRLEAPPGSPGVTITPPMVKLSANLPNSGEDNSFPDSLPSPHCGSIYPVRTGCVPLVPVSAGRLRWYRRDARRVEGAFGGKPER